MTPTVTIVIPTRERPDYLRATLHSVLASAAEAALVGIETRVLVVDDASPTDSSRRLSAELRVGYFRIETHDGRNNPASAIAVGVSLVETEYQSIFGDDDIMLPRFIAAHVEALEAGFDVCTTAFLRTDARLRTTREVILPEPALGDLLAGRITINDGAMTRSSLVKQLPWDPDLEQAIFYPIWLELLYTGARCTRLTDPMFLYRRHSENVSDQLDARDAELRNAIRDRYAARVLARDGAIPAPSVPVRAARPPPPKPPVRPARGRTILRRAKAALRILRTG